MHLLWDFDGTLFDTYPVYAAIFADVLGLAQEEIPAIKEKLKISHRHAVSFYNISDAQEEAIQHKKNRIDPSSVFPFEGVKEVLASASSNVIMTHSPKSFVLPILHYHQMAHFFSRMVTKDDGFPRKPDASAYRYLHGIQPVDFVIGDRDLDVLPAKELGIRTCIYQSQSDIADYRLAHYGDFFKLNL